jgi:LacI family transcriptional regulator
MVKTLKDVAQVAGVSSATVSLVLNGHSHGRVSADLVERVEKAAQKLNYRPNLVARSLRTQESKTIGIISNDVATSPFAGAMLSGAQEVAWRNGWFLLLVNTNGDRVIEKAATRSLIQRNVDGVIYAAMFHQEIETPEYLTNQQVVLLDCIDSEKKLDSVVPDDYQGAVNAVEYLILQGHTKIAHISFDPTSIASQKRKKAYKDVLTKFGIEFREDYLIGDRDAIAQEGYLLTKELLGLDDRPTAIFTGNDRMAMGAYAAINESGLLIPSDISVIGFDNQTYLADALMPGLTTIQLPHLEMGAWAVTRLLEVIDSQNSEPLKQMGQVIACPLVIRDSVAPPRK